MFHFKEAELTPLNIWVNKTYASAKSEKLLHAF